MQRLLPVEAESWVHGARHEAVICSPGKAAASTIGIEVAPVIQRSKPQVAHQLAIE